MWIHFFFRLSFFDLEFEIYSQKRLEWMTDKLYIRPADVNS